MAERAKHVTHDSTLLPFGRRRLPRATMAASILLPSRQQHAGVEAREPEREAPSLSSRSADVQ